MSAADKFALRVIDFFGGVGGNSIGLGMALDALGLRDRVDLQVVASLEINQHAQAAHQLNAPPGCIAIAKGIETVTPRELNALRSNVWLLSPPCQPFTRQGKQEGAEDNRCAALSHILHTLLPQCNVKPEIVYVENVKNFETSAARDELVATLGRLGYTTITEHLFNPADAPLQWPNSRLRYYLVATRYSATPGTLATTHGITQFESAPVFIPSRLRRGPVPIGELLGNVPLDTDRSAAILPERLLCRSGRLLDIVQPSATRTNCFTKNYARKLEGAGSVLCAAPPEVVSSVFDAHDAASCAGDSSCPLNSLGIRFFLPEEVARLMGFPDWFRFPASLTTRQRWNLLGNSVNPLAVSLVLRPVLEARFCNEEPMDTGV
jgi:tRNA (cytosine38-C5)-methyltransferase